MDLADVRFADSDFDVQELVERVAQWAATAAEIEAADQLHRHGESRDLCAALGPAPQAQSHWHLCCAYESAHEAVLRG